MSSIDEALVNVVSWVTFNKTLNEHHDYDKYRQRMDRLAPPVIEKAFTLLHKEGYDFVLTPGKEDTIASNDNVAMEGEQGRVMQAVGPYTGSFKTLADTAVSTAQKSKTMPKYCEYIGSGYAQVRYSVAIVLRGMKIHVTTDPQQKAKMKKVLYENLLGQGGALQFCPGYGNRKDPQKNFANLFTYVWNGIKHNNGEYVPRDEPDFDSDEYDAYLLQKLSHTIMQEAAAAAQKVADAAAKKANMKKENEESEAQIGLRTGAKSGSGLGGHTSSRSHSVTNLAMSFGT